MRAALTAFATGILLFLLWDVLAHGVEPVEAARRGARLGPRRPARAAARRRARARADEPRLLRPLDDAASAPRRSSGRARRRSTSSRSRSWLERLTPGRRLALLIATGIGLHNFGEGLAIGQAAAPDEVSLALVLIIGFALHNATEGFGIVGPMSGEAERPSWGFLALLGPDRRRPDLRRHRDRPGVGERGAAGGVLRRRGGLDPLRRHPAARRLPPLRAADASSPGGSCSGCCSASPRTSCSSPPGPDLALGVRVWAPSSTRSRSSSTTWRTCSWGALGLALALPCDQAALPRRARGRTSSTRRTRRTRSSSGPRLGAYIAGVGVNSIAPARGGDLVKLYLVKHRIEDATYPTLALDARRRDDLRLRRRRRADDLGALDRRAADAPGLLAHPDRRLEVRPAPPAREPGSCSRSSSWSRARALLLVRASRVEDFWDRVGLGFAILSRPPRRSRSA